MLLKAFVFWQSHLCHTCFCIKILYKLRMHLDGLDSWHKTDCNRTFPVQYTKMFQSVKDIPASNWFVLSFYVIILILGFCFDNVIKTYLNSKPMGMQTLLDRVTVQFLGFHALSNCLGCFMLGLCFEIFTPLDVFDETGITLVTYMFDFITIMFLISVFLTLTTR